MKQTKLLKVAHESAKGLYEAGLMDAITMREFDILCLPDVEALSPRQIKNIRLSEKMSQAVFAKHLNTSVSTIQHWEQGEKKPRGIALRFLQLIADKGITALFDIK